MLDTHCTARNTRSNCAALSLKFEPPMRSCGKTINKFIDYKIINNVKLLLLNLNRRSKIYPQIAVHCQCHNDNGFWKIVTTVNITPPDAATKWRRLKHCIALFQGPTLHPRIRNQMLGFLSFFSTTMSHTSDFWLDYRGRLRCTYQTSAESVKIASKTDELWGARHAATIALAHYYVQVNGAAELVAHARRTQVLNRCSMGVQNAHQLDQGVKNCKFLQTAVNLKAESKAELIVSIKTLITATWLSTY